MDTLDRMLVTMDLQPMKHEDLDTMTTIVHSNEITD